MELIIFNTVLVCLIIAMCLYATLLIHEAGHLYCALIFGSEVSSIAIGNGLVLFKSSINKIPIFIRIIPLGASINYNVEPDRFNSDSTYKKIVISLAGPLASILASLVAYSLYMVLKQSGIYLQIDFYSLYCGYGHIPGIPCLLYWFFYLITNNFANTVLVLVVLNFMGFAHGMLPILEHDFGKSIFNIISLYDTDFEHTVVYIFLILSAGLKLTLHVAILFLSIMDIYRFAI